MMNAQVKAQSKKRGRDLNYLTIRSRTVESSKFNLVLVEQLCAEECDFGGSFSSRNREVAPFFNEWLDDAGKLLVSRSGRSACRMDLYSSTSL